ncbi:MAG: amidohydrolase [Candidatus Baltobacteraceae bacterium]
MQPGSADLIVVGATIHTADEAAGPARALAIRGGRFAHVGSVEGAMALRGPATRMLDLSGYTILPGLVDAHLHLTRLGLTLGHVDLRELGSFEEVVARTVAFARGACDEWIVGEGWNQDDWPGRAFPIHDALTAALPDRPAALSRIDGHAVLANAAAMTLASIDPATPDPPGGRIVRDSSGRPTGLFVDAAQALIFACVPAPAHGRLQRATQAAIRECNRWGVTAVAEPGTSEATIAAHIALLERGEYSMRNHAMLYDDDALLEPRFRAGIVDGAFDGRLSTRAVKTFADGALGSRGAALLAPYADDPGNDGLIVTPVQKIARLAERALRAGFQLCAHAIGDRANREVLDAYQTALERVPGGDPRLRVEHAQVLDPADVPRFAGLGVIASMQATHRTSDMAWAPARLGPTRILGAYAWRALLDSGAVVANGTDAPVEPVSTPRTFYASIAGDDGRAMTRREALASMTIWAARANFQEHLAGSIGAGKYADFVVMDRDWMTVNPRSIEATKIVATYFAGRRVYEDGAPAPIEPGS